MRYPFSTIVAASGMLFAACGAQASISSMILDSENDLAAAGFSDNVNFNADGRIGNLGSSGNAEVVVGNLSVGALQDAENFIWTNGQAEDFSLTYDGTTASFTVDSVTAMFAVGPQSVNALAFRISAGSGRTVELRGIQIDGNPINPDFVHGNIGNSFLDRVEVLLVKGLGDLSSGFTVTGQATLNWDAADVPSGNALAFQIKTGTTEVPVPASLALLGFGLAGFGCLARRRIS